MSSLGPKLGFTRAIDATLIDPRTAGKVPERYTGTRFLRTTWALMVLSLSMSGLSLGVGSVKILPEHLMLLVLTTSCMLTPGLLSGIGAIRKRQFIALLSIVTWFVVAVLSSLANSPEPSQSLRLLLWTAVNLVALLVAFLHPLPLLIKVRDTLTLACAAAGFYFLAWVFSTASGIGTVFTSKDYASESFRAQGLMLEPNLLAAFCVLVAALSFVYRRHFSGKFLTVALTVLGLTVAATITRVAWAMFAAIIVAFLFKRATLLVRILLISALILLIALVAEGGVIGGAGSALVETFGARLNTMFQLDGGTGRFRLQSAAIAMDEIQRAGFPGGLGFNSFPQRHESSLTSTGDLYLGLLWLVIFYDGGVLGGILFLIAFVAVWASSPKSASLFFLAFAAVATTTNPIWYAFPWVLVALVFSARSLGSSLPSKGVQA
jgi:hypothetical protein